jgi:hypothetical protein
VVALRSCDRIDRRKVDDIALGCREPDQRIGRPGGAVEDRTIDELVGIRPSGRRVRAAPTGQPVSPGKPEDPVRGGIAGDVVRPLGSGSDRPRR